MKIFEDEIDEPVSKEERRKLDIIKKQLEKVLSFRFFLIRRRRTGTQKRDLIQEYLIVTYGLQKPQVSAN